MKVTKVSILTLLMSGSFAFAESVSPTNPQSAQKVGDVILSGNSVSVPVESQNLEVFVECEFQTRTAQVSEDYGHPGSYRTVVVAKGYQCPVAEALEKVKKQFPNFIKIESLDDTTKNLFDIGSNLGTLSKANLKIKIYQDVRKSPF